MRSTRKTPIDGRYLGVDLTDAFARSPRPTDVCALRRTQTGLEAELWTWHFDPADRRAVDVAPILEEIRDARGVVIDGPQALARRGEKVRECERVLATPGRTPGALSRARGPYAGFLRTSVALFAALSAHGIPCGAPSLVGGVAEQYPGGTWSLLASSLARKATLAGRSARRSVLEALGVVFPSIDLPTHDELDACLGAVIAAAHDGTVPGIVVRRVGIALRRGPPMREGEILVVDIDAGLRVMLDRAAAWEAPMNAPVAPPRAIAVWCTPQMVASRTTALAVSGVRRLCATAAAPLRIDLGADGALVLGDHAMFWRAHQEDDVTARTFARLLEERLLKPGEARELEVVGITRAASCVPSQRKRSRSTGGATRRDDQGV